MLKNHGQKENILIYFLLRLGKMLETKRNSDSITIVILLLLLRVRFGNASSIFFSSSIITTDCLSCGQKWDTAFSASLSNKNPPICLKALGTVRLYLSISLFRAPLSNLKKHETY